MAIDLITEGVRLQVETRLAAVDGFNATANSYGGIVPVSIDFTGAGFNFFRGQLNPVELEKSSAIKYPIMTIWGSKIQDTHKQKFQTFNGLVTIGIDFHIGFPSSKAQFDFERLPDVVETTIVDIVNRPSNQDWSPSTLYNGDIAGTRFPLLMASSNWRQSLRFMMSFEVVET